jgi:hypothetical protein
MNQREAVNLPSLPRKTTHILSDSQVDDLFQQFLDIWDTEWARKIATGVDGKKKRWAESLGEFNWSTIQKAVDDAAKVCDLPPSIARMREFCSKHQQTSGVLYQDDDNGRGILPPLQQREVEVITLIKKVYYANEGWCKRIVYEIVDILKSHKKSAKAVDPNADEFQVLAIIEADLRNRNATAISS